jgi:hypothetical protein
MIKRLLHGISIFLVASFVGLNTSSAVTTQDRLPKQVSIQKKTPLYDRTPRGSRSYARATVLTTYKWRLSEYTCLRKIWDRESHWNHLADNKSSSAFGIPQMLGMTTKNPQKQINIGLKYIKHRYGTPCVAWDYWKVHHWY